jgi:hypothetical protein
VFDKVQRTLLETHMLHLSTFWKHAPHLRKSLESMRNLFQHIFVCVLYEYVFGNIYAIFHYIVTRIPLLGNGSLNIFPQKQRRGTTCYLLLGNGAVNRLCQQNSLCFPWGPCKEVIRGSSSEAGSSVQLSAVELSSSQLRVQLWSVNQWTTEAKEPPLLRFVTKKRLEKTLQRNSQCGELLPSKD